MAAGLAFLGNLPGIDAAINTVENEFLFGPNGLWVPSGVVIDSTATDSGNTPTTTLRKGLVIGLITASGNYKAYNSQNTDGSQIPVGILYQATNVYDPDQGITRNKSALMIYAGHVKTGNLYGFDENARRILSPRFVWDDYREVRGGFGPTVPQTTNYTVLPTDNDKAFTTTGAAAPVTFTLPTPVAGLRFRFLNVVNQNMTITAPTGTLIGPNNATRTSVAFTTGGQLIGSAVEIVSDDTGNFYFAIPLGSNTATFS